MMLIRLMLPFLFAILFSSVLTSQESEEDEKEAEKLLHVTYFTALRRSEYQAIRQRNRRMVNEDENSMHQMVLSEFLTKKDDIEEVQETTTVRHLYNITVPNDEFDLHEDGQERSHDHGGKSYTSPHEEGHEESHEEIRPPSSDPHPVVQNSQNMDTSVNSLLASASSLKMQSVQLQSKAAELEKEAEQLHAKAGGPVAHAVHTPVTDKELSSSPHEEKQSHGENEHHPADDNKCCKDGMGPERGGYATRPIINGVAFGDKPNQNPAPPPPKLGPPTFEAESPVDLKNIGYPMFNLPPKTGEIPISEYIKPLPPLLGANPYEVLTSSSLNGTAYKTQPFGVPSQPAAGAFAQKYVITLQDLKKFRPTIDNHVSTHHNLLNSELNAYAGIGENVKRSHKIIKIKKTSNKKKIKQNKLHKNYFPKRKHKRAKRKSKSKRYLTKF